MSAAAPNNGAAVAATSEESLMKTRLLIDGNGDDRRLALLLKNVILFCNSESTPEETRRSYDRILAQMAHCEWIDSKSKLVQKMNQVELNNYQELHSDIEKGIKRAHEDIKAAKEELVEAKNIRRNKMEYDAMAKTICEIPDRETTGRKLQEVEEELARLKRREEKLDEKLELRKKQCHLLVHTIHQLQDLLSQDDDDDEDISDASSTLTKDVLVSGTSVANEEASGASMDVSE